MGGIRTTSSQRLILWALNGAAFVVLAVWGLLFLNSINPMQVEFVRPLHVQNDSGERILVTPLGCVNGRVDEKERLPTYVRRFPAILSWKNSDHGVDPGETITILYDWDDIDLSEIVVEFPDDTAAVKTVRSTFVPGRCHMPPTAPVRIGNRAELAPASADSLAATKGTSTIYLLLIALLPISIAVHISSLWFWYRNRRGRRARELKDDRHRR